MKNKLFSKSVLWLMALAMLMPLTPLKVLAEEDVLTVNDPALDVSTEVTAAEIGLTGSQINNATVEPSTTETVTGTLIEIGNTTSKMTSIIIRIKNKLNQMVDQTIEVDSSTLIQNDANSTSNLNDFIAGDQVTYTTENYSGGSMRAQKIKNRAIRWAHQGRNGWITAIRPEENEMDLKWGNLVYTLNTAGAKMVSGTINPATLNDFKIGDRVRSRVEADNDGNPLTWNAKIVVVLRRGNDLFMRVSRWVVPGKIITMPEDLTWPFTMEVKVLPNSFYQEGDVNNLIGAPGKIIKVDVTEDTKLFRRFLGKALLKEFSEDDEISIIGRLDEASGHLVAKFIVNKSIQKIGKIMRLGKVNSVDLTANTIDITLIRTRRAMRNWTIRVFPATKIIKDGTTITLADIQPTDKLRIVGGSADFTNNTVIALKIVVLLPKPEQAETPAPAL
jgi:hypothetical protein